MAVRTATRLGLHREAAQAELPPFDQEQRRRLWWQIVGLDKRLAEMTGSAITALSSSSTDCCFPLNVNDTELTKLALKAPQPYKGVTEVTFALTRAEVTFWMACKEARQGPSALGQKRRTFADRTLQDLDKHIQITYLDYCDTNVPIQNFTILLTKWSLNKVRIAEHLHYEPPSTTYDNAENDLLFIAAIEMLECDNVILTATSIRKFLWYNKLQVPMLGHMVLMKKLCAYTSGESCERAWDAVQINYHCRNLVNDLKNPMHAKNAKMLLQAWQVHQGASADEGIPQSDSSLIGLIRQRLADLVTEHVNPPLATMRDTTQLPGSTHRMPPGDNTDSQVLDQSDWLDWMENIDAGDLASYLDLPLDL